MFGETFWMVSVNHLTYGAVTALVLVMLGACSSDTRGAVRSEVKATPSQLTGAGGDAVPARVLPLPPTTSLTAKMERVIGGSTGFVDVSGLLVTADRVFVLDRQLSPHLQLFDRGSGRALETGAPHGEGIGSFVDPGCFSLASEQPPTIWMFDANRQTLSRLQLNLAAQDATREELQLEGPTLRCASWVAGRIIGLDASGSGNPIVEYDRSGRRLRRIPVPVDSTAPVLKTKAIVYRADGLRYAVIYRRVQRIDVFHASGQLDRIIIPHTPNELGASCAGAHQKAQYESLAATQRAIFVTALVNTEQRSETEHSCLLAFSWEGEALNTFEIDRALSQIAVDPSNTNLIGAYSVQGGAMLVGQWKIDLNTIRSAVALTKR